MLLPRKARRIDKLSDNTGQGDPSYPRPIRGHFRPRKLAELLLLRDGGGGAVAAAQTVTAAVCCQTLRGEEGKKNKREVMDFFFFFNKPKTLQVIPPSQFYQPSRRVLFSVDTTSRSCINVSTKWINVLHFADLNETQNPICACSKRWRRHLKKKCARERLPRLCSCPAAACQRAPMEGSFGTAVTRNRLETQQLRRLEASTLDLQFCWLLILQ